MSRVLMIVGLVGLLLATGIAGAAPADQVRLPVTIDAGNESSPQPDTVVVEKGDHLWRISARHLGEEATNDDIAPYWLEVIDVNVPHLRSGDPDLIYPGEVIELP